MSLPDVIRYALLFTHIIGLAAVIGSYILQMPWKRGFDFLPLVIGSGVALLTGLGLVATLEITGAGVDRVKIIVKLCIAVVVAVLAVTGLIRSRALTKSGADDAGLKPLLLAAGLAAMANVAVALFWR